MIKEGSNIGKDRGPKVKTVGRFKLSEIYNMDQTPLAFEFLDGRTYNSKGAKTVWLKEGKSGHNKRQATLQITVCAMLYLVSLH